MARKKKTDSAETRVTELPESVAEGRLLPDGVVAEYFRALVPKHANAMSVTHTPREFVFDFYFILPQNPPIPIARITTSPGHAQDMYETLRRNITSYREKVGPPDRGSAATGPLNVHELRLLAALVARNGPLPLTKYQDRQNKYSAAKQSIVTKGLAERRNRNFVLTEAGLARFREYVEGLTATRSEGK